MGSSTSMKMHPFTRAGFWDHHHHHQTTTSTTIEPATLSLGCKRLRPLAPKTEPLHHRSTASFDLKSFIRPESGPRKLLSSSSSSSDDRHNHSSTSTPQVETHPGGTRWNPTQEQIGILEMLYRGGMRTPNAQQIEQITEQLAKYGKIEGKNVFYWFQNHKARERQKQKRNILGLSHSPRTPSPSMTTVDTSSIAITITLYNRVEKEHSKEEESPYKKCKSWTFETLEEENDVVRNEGDKTLELFPLKPEGRSMINIQGFGV